ncbi:MAG TPA: DNA replication/repair protein RecF [Legionella sp.]|nr:DNA replication/repair protein RecF [Legionella sp.]
MSVAQLNVHHVRNIASAQLTLHPRYNVFYGANGSGKTSLLEAIYLLSTGHSFGTREIASLVQRGESALTVFARTHAQDTVSIQKSIAHPTQVKINQQPCQRSSDLAHFFPCQAFHQGIFQIMDEGPSVRRSLLDWGLFHVEPSYLSVWKDYRRIVKQRNALLRQKASLPHCLPWNSMLVERAVALDRMRADYFKQWSSVFQTFVSQLTDTPCTIHYYKGWDKKGSGKDLSTILLEQFNSDIQAQYTHSGAHHADILFDAGPIGGKPSLSRGQQKIILVALRLAQAHLLPKPCVYLFDDITAELDSNHVERFFNCLNQVKGQFFLTSIDPNHLLNAYTGPQQSTVYLIKKGCFT